MGFFSGMGKKNKELDAILLRVANNAENNYKDAAQAAFKEYMAKYQELQAEGKLNAKQLTYYEAARQKYEVELKNFHH